jgi:hypothetical protein
MTFFLELWHDLREKRLWPVAVGLLAATIAIPLIMLKPASEPQEPTVIANTGTPELMPMVKVDDGPAHGSKLQAFADSRRNPFRPLADLEEDTTSTSTSGGSSSDSGTGSSSSGGSSTGSSSTGGSSTSSGGSGGGSTPPGIDPNGPSVQWFKYTADIRFGTPNNMERMKDVGALTLLPDDKNPAIVFMGVSDDAKSAIFFIADPAFTADGEGECNAEGSDCRFVKLGLSDGKNEESFTSQDGSIQYDLELVRLNRENISSSDAKGDATDTQSKPTAEAADGKRASAFLPRLLFLPGVARESQ